MNTGFDARNPARFDLPIPPQEFGQDGGKFYHYYDALADEIDDNMVTGLKEQLDGLLIFAGLFARVNSAFLALTLPLMSPDPADDTNALLQDILAGMTLPSTNTLPSETFSPNGKILTVNVLFAVSLTFALFSSFLAVLGRQWLVYYRKQTGGGPKRQRWEQLKRFLGAERWQLELVLDDLLPSLLQVGLIIFCLSLTIYLNTLHPLLSNVVGAFMCAGLGILIVTAMFAIWDKFCPFQSPLSHFILLVSQTVGRFFTPLLRTILWPFSWIAVALHNCFVYGPHYVAGPWGDDTTDNMKNLLEKYVITPITSLPDYVQREEEEDGTLQIIAIRHAICTSDDALTQAHAVSNILGITDADLLGRLVTDEELDGHISELCANLAAATSWLYRAAITHIFLSTVNPGQQLTDQQQARIHWGTLNNPSLSLSTNLMQNASPSMTIASLGFMALFSNTGRIPPQTSHLSLRATIDRLVNPSWKSISMITKVIMKTFHRASKLEVAAEKK
ncbi:hypothetical protein FS837_007265 [Tulasnella sp. UAMH 9824]|nr:hypothetical protein FS837_007265 [Tulasnella sp. UAMH 9824]